MPLFVFRAPLIRLRRALLVVADTKDVGALLQEPDDHRRVLAVLSHLDVRDLGAS